MTTDDREWQEIELSDGTIHRMPKPESGVGNPADPNYRKLLTEEEEKSVDDKGNFVVAGAPWSKVGTGVYLVIGVTPAAPGIDRPWIHSRTITLPTAFSTAGRQLTIGCTTGKPAFTTGVWGACMELPSDLGRDQIKAQYVVEWLVNTIEESVLMSGGTMPPKMSEPRKEMGYWVQGAAEAAIQGAGF